MFEGKPPRADEASPAGPKVDRDSLRPLVWADLVSRLAAARDLRASLAQDGGADGEGSFAATHARRLAAHHDGKDPVNLEVSANGKGPRAIGPEAQFARRNSAVRD